MTQTLSIVILDAIRLAVRSCLACPRPELLADRSGIVEQSPGGRFSPGVRRRRVWRPSVKCLAVCWPGRRHRSGLAWAGYARSTSAPTDRLPPPRYLGLRRLTALIATPSVTGGPHPQLPDTALLNTIDLPYAESNRPGSVFLLADLSISISGHDIVHHSSAVLFVGR